MNCVSFAKKAIGFILVLMVSVVYANEIQYKVEPSSEANLKFSIPYTFGVHEGITSVLNGQIITDQGDRVTKGYFEIPISEMKTGNKTRDCHMLEALGLDYSVSRFPNEHVCDRNNMLEKSGPDSIAFSSIVIEFLDMVLPKDPFVLGVPHAVDINIKITMHGITKVLSLNHLLVTKTLNRNDKPGFRVVGMAQLSLTDFNIKVKPLKLGFTSVGVRNEVKVQFDFGLIASN